MKLTRTLYYVSRFAKLRDNFNSGSRVMAIRGFINILFINHAVAAQSNFFYHARSNEISWKNKKTRMFACNGISQFFAIRTNIEYHAKRRLRNFFRLPFSEAPTFRPRHVPNDSYESLFFFRDLLSSRRTSGRRPFRLYDFLLEEIDFQLAFHSNAHDSPNRNFSPRKFALASSICDSPRLPGRPRDSTSCERN